MENGKINASVWFQCLKKKTTNLIEKIRCTGRTLVEPQKAHPTSEFVVVA